MLISSTIHPVASLIIRTSLCRSRPWLLTAVAIPTLALAISAPPAQAVPVTLIVDNPHQTVARPASGTIVVDFIGTVSFGVDFHFTEAILDFEYNRFSTDCIPTDFGPLNFSSANGGSVTGTLFTAEVSPSTVPGLYGFHFGTSEPAIFSIEGGDDGRFVTVMRSFSIRVTNGVPDASNSALLLSLSLAILLGFRRKLIPRYASNKELQARLHESSEVS